MGNQACVEMLLQNGADKSLKNVWNYQIKSWWDSEMWQHVKKMSVQRMTEEINDFWISSIYLCIFCAILEFSTQLQNYFYSFILFFSHTTFKDQVWKFLCWISVWQIILGKELDRERFFLLWEKSVRKRKNRFHCIVWMRYSKMKIESICLSFIILCRHLQNELDQWDTRNLQT